MADLALLVLILALLSAVGTLVLFGVLVCGIRAADRRRDLSNNASTPAEQVSRRMLLYSHRHPHTDDTMPAPAPPRARRR